MHLFISHSNSDKALAHMLAERLETRQYEVFLDFSRKYGIPGGAEWEKAILDAIRKSAAVLLCCTPSVFKSQWAFAEVMIARYEGKRVFPLLFSGDPNEIWEFLRARIQYIDFTGEPEQGYIRLFEALEQAGFIAPTTPIEQLDRPPYVGLQPLQMEDHPFFFARRQDADQVIEMLQPRLGGKRRFITIVGPSGSGKSSMIRAGLLPRLKGGAVPSSADWTYVIFSPGHDPYRRLAEALRRTLPALGTVRVIETALRADEYGLDYMVADVLAIRPPESSVLLVIDQLEELLTRTDEDDRIRFLKSLLLATNETNERNGRLIVIATLRADFYSAFLEMQSDTVSLLQNTYPLGPLEINKLRQVIEGPALVAMIGFEEGLVQRILNDAGTSDVLPLLSFVLRSMYDSIDGDNYLFTHVLYEQLGGLQGALGLHAERMFNEVTEEVGTALMEAILEHLVLITADGKATRRRVRQNELPPKSMPGVDRFIEARLFIAGEEDGHPTVEVAHEAIFRNWSRLANAIAKESATIQYLRQVLHQGLADWERLGIFLGAEQRKLLNQHRQSISLESPQLELALRSSIRANDEIPYWFNRVSQESTRIPSIASNILSKGDPFSRHHLLDFLEKLIQGGNKDLLELVVPATSSEYPALRRHAKRIVTMYGSVKQTSSKSSKTEVITIEFVLIEAGECIVGPDNNQAKVFVNAFEISKYPITNLEYFQFIQATGYNRPAHWTDDLGFPGKADHPVVHISWYDANAFCEWLSSTIAKVCRLPTEIEWEKAASWDPQQKKKRAYPWGDRFENSLCNTNRAQTMDTTPIGQYSPHGGDSYYGVSDLAGNVWEWTCTLGQDSSGKFLDYPSSQRNVCDSVEVWGPRVQRGGTYLASEKYVTTIFRLINLPELPLQDFGFRVVCETGGVND